MRDSAAPLTEDPWAKPGLEGIVPPAELRVESPCPGCREVGGLSLVTVESEVPNFGRSLRTLLRCATCGFRHADFMMLDQREPTRLMLRATGADHLQARVIRSTSCTWKLAELGFMAEPSTLSEAFITNVEGLLDRAADVILTALQQQEDPDKRRLCEDLLARVNAMQDGREPVTVVLEDPFGNSALVHDDVVRESLTPEEAAALSPGLVVIDSEDLKDELG